MVWTKDEADRAVAKMKQRSQTDPAFRALCLSDPAAAVKQIAGQELSHGFKLRIVENNHADLTIVLPDPILARADEQELRDDELASVSGGAGGAHRAPAPAPGPGVPSIPNMGSCFAAGTPVLMANGTSRPIEALIVGDQVLAFDEQQRRVVVDSVAKVMHHDPEPIHRARVEGVEHALLLTTNHHFYSLGQWSAIRDLAPRAELYHYDPALREASPRRLLSLEPTGRDEAVYNLEVERVHTYFAGGLLVHNGDSNHK